ncbi:MAG: T9SS type A sorting domain-containing protein [Bacteroidetes bacterium]|nr:T9SS type A sorting domain-containing protein [Bacteroidota bacterium]
MKSIRNLMTALLIMIGAISYGQSAGPDQILCRSYYSSSTTATMAATGSGTWSAVASNPAGAVIINATSPTTSIFGLSSDGLFRFIWTTASGADTMQIRVSTLVAPYIAESGFCAGTDTLTIASAYTASDTFRWYRNNVLVASYTSQYRPATTGQYTVVANNIYGCQSFSSNSATIPDCNCGLSALDSVRGATCGNSDGGAYIYPSSGNAIKYKNGLHGGWQPFGQFTNLAAGVDTFYMMDTTTYCGASVIVTIPNTNSVSPTVSITTSQSTVCQSSSDTFYAATTGNVLYTYQWYVNDTPQGSYYYQYFTGYPHFNEGDSVWVVISSSLACVSPSSIKSNVIYIHKGAVSPLSLSLTASQTVLCSSVMDTFYVTASPADGYFHQYTWYIDDSVISTNRYNTVPVRFPMYVGNGDTVKVRIQSSSECVSPRDTFSNAIVVTNVTSAASVSITASALNICGNATDTFRATAVNAGSAPTYQWYLNGTAAGTGSSTYITSTLASGDSIWVVLPGTTSCSGGPATSNHLHVTVTPAPATPTITLSGGTCSTDTLHISGATGATVITWYANGVPIGTSGSTFTGPVTVAGGNGSGSAANQLNYPSGIALDATGNLYVADGLNHRVQKFAAGSTSATNAVTVAGGLGSGSALNKLYTPRGIYVDATGNIYVGEENNNRVTRFPAGSTAGSYGTIVAGTGSQSSAANGVGAPLNVALDASGQLVVTDFDNQRIQRFPVGSTAGTNGTTIAGTAVAGGTSAQLNGPTSSCYDAAGNLYVADYNNARVQKFAAGSSGGSSAVTVAGGNGSGSALNQLYHPEGVAVDAAGNLFVSDEGNSRVLMFPPGSTSTTYGTVVAGGNGAGSGANQLNHPYNLAFDAAGNLYVADLNNARIQKYTRSGGTIYIPATAGTYTATYTTAGGCTSPVSNSISVSPSVTPSVAVTVSSATICSGAVDTFTAHPTNGGSAPSYQWYLNGAPVGTNNAVYISSGLHDYDSIAVVMTSNAGCATTTTVRSIAVTIRVNASPAAPTLSVISACPGADTLVLSGVNSASTITWYLGGVPVSSGTTSFSPYTVAGGNGAGSAANQLHYPSGISLDAAGNLYVADGLNNRVQKFPAGSTAATNGITVAGGNGQGSALNQLYVPRGLYADAVGNIYVGEENNNRVTRFPAGSTSATLGTVVAGTGVNTSAATSVSAPLNIYVDLMGHLYVTDFDNQRVIKFPTGSTAGTAGTNIAGSNVAGSGLSQLSGPTASCFDAAGNLYVSDYYNHRVMKFAAGSTGGASGIVAAGGNGQGSALNQLYHPEGVALDAAGNLYVSDEGNSRIIRFAPGSTSATSGTVVAGGNGVGAAADQLDHPYNIAFDLVGNLYVSDLNNSRIQKWSLVQANTSYVPTTPGTYTATYTGSNGCVSPPSNPITTTPCLSDSIWPGDADHNGIADHNDLLPIGTAYGLNGFPRATTSIVWQADYCQDWGVQFLNGTNTKHADCNGNGVIDANDTTAILANFGLTHNKTGGSASWRTGAPVLGLRFSVDTAAAGDSVIVNIVLGDSTATVANIYGLAFTYHYDPAVVDSHSVQFGFVNSFLGGSTDKISLYKNFNATGEIKAAVTGINHINKNGFGLIAKLNATITTGNINGKDYSYYNNLHYISDITAIDIDGYPVTINEGMDSNKIAYEPNGILQTDRSRIQVYPNPVTDILILETDGSMTSSPYSLIDVTGRVVLTGQMSGTRTPVSLATLSPGVYTLRVGDKKYAQMIIKE